MGCVNYYSTRADVENDTVKQFTVQWVMLTGMNSGYFTVRFCLFENRYTCILVQSDLR